MNLSLRLPNARMRCKAAFADSFMRFRGWLLPALLAFRFLAMGSLQSYSEHIDS
jgi:hypothetical protein